MVEEASTSRINFPNIPQRIDSDILYQAFKDMGIMGDDAPFLAEATFSPSSVKLTYYLQNDEGHRYWTRDVGIGNHGNAARTTITIPLYSGASLIRDRASLDSEPATHSRPDADQQEDVVTRALH